MSGDEPAASRVKRMLPSVSEVLKELTARAQIEPDVAFRAAREVCAEELKRIRDVGGDSVPLEELVQRAWQRATATYPQAPAAPPPRPAPPVYAAPESPARHAGPEGDDPFSETAGAMDLRWEGEGREPFTEPQQPGTPRAGTPPPEPYAGGPAPGEASPTLKLQLEHAASSPVPLEPQTGEEAQWPDAHPARLPEPEVSEGPGDETLGRLSREAESIDLRSVLRGAGAHGAVSFPPADGDAGVREEAPLPDGPAAAPFEDDEDTVLTVPRGGRRAGRDESGSRAGVVIGTLFGLVALAALGYLLVGLWLERDAAPVPVAVAKPRPSRTAEPSGSKTAEPAAPAAGAVPAAPATAPVPASAAAPAPSAAPSVTAHATAAPPLSIARPASPPSSVAATPATPTTGRVPVKPAPPAAATAASAAPAVAPPTTAASAPVRQSRDGLVVTKDRAGLPQIYSIHFTSYKDRAAAERDLKRIEKLVGRDGFVAEVDLGEKGIWQRVMIGAFATAQEAKAAREELVAKRTPDMGWVYRVVAPEAAGPR